MLEITEMREVGEKDIREAISCMKQRRADAYGGDRVHFDLAIAALRRLEAQYGEG